MNGYDFVAKLLKKEGFDWIACFPDNALINACAQAGVRPIVFRHERGGIMAADGFSRMMASEGKYGVFCCQHGPGVENAFGGIAQAWGDAVPILFLADGYPTTRTSVKPTFGSVRNYANITKFAAGVTGIDLLAPIMRHALVKLRNGRPGPVLVELPRDVMPQDVPNAEPFAVSRSFRSAPAAGDVKDAAKKLVEAKNPVLWAGQGALYSTASSELTELAELVQAPVITTMPGKSAIDERHPLALGATTKSAPKGVWKWLRESDLLLALGASLTKTNYGIDIPSGKFLIHNTNNVEDIGKEYATDIGLPGDTKLTLAMLLDEVKSLVGENGRRGDETVPTAVATVKKEWLSEWNGLLNDNDLPINPYRLINELNKAVDHETTIMTHDAGHPRDQILPFYTATIPRSYIGWGKTTHLGYGIPLMIGVKIAMPDRFCVNFMGDAAFGMSGLDIETAVRSGNPTTTIVLNNGTMGGYDKRMPSAMQEYGAGNMGGNYAKVAEGLGAVGVEIGDPNEIGAALTKARQINDNDGRSVLLDVKTRTEPKMSVY